MKAFILLIMILFCSSSALFAASSCDEKLIEENENCRTIFKQCMANPIFTFVCAGQLNNCSYSAQTKSSDCSRHQRICMNQLKDAHANCQAYYLSCLKNPRQAAICANDFDQCSQTAETQAKACLENVINYLYQ